MADEEKSFISKIDEELKLQGLGDIQYTKDREDIQTLNAYAEWFKATGNKKRWLNKKDFTINSEQISRWKFTEQYFYDVMKKGSPPSVGSTVTSLDLPPFLDKFLARGLFTYKDRVAIRGYDKFFNVGELSCTEWEALEHETTGPYEVTVKENGCIIFVSHHPVEGLMVASKHSLGDPESTEKNTHQEMGENWLNKHLDSGTRDKATMERFVRHFNVTLVFELCDDEFEEHVLPYLEDSRGLYLHGINYNAIQFISWPSCLVQLVAEFFGFLKVGNFPQPTLDHVRKFSEASKGFLNGRAIEGFVVRCSKPPMLFKIKYDDPYLMFREWREITRRLLTAKSKRHAPPVVRKRFPLTHNYVAWVQEKIASHPAMFQSYLDGKGIVQTRDQFFADTNHSPFDIPAVASISSTWDHVLLVPVATIGCGKSVLGAVLKKLINCVVVQRDDFKGPASFHDSILAQLESNQVVFADRNNHTSMLRETLTSTVLAKFPSTAMVAIEWDVSTCEVFGITYRNVLMRGPNHPTLTPNHTHDLERVMCRFLEDFESVDANSYLGDANFTHHIKLPVGASLPNLIVSDILPALPLVPPNQLSLTEITEALNASLKSQTLVKFKGKKMPESAAFIGISLASNIFGLVFERLCSKDAPINLPIEQVKEAKELFQKMTGAGTTFGPGSHHVTLTHSSSPIQNDAYLNNGPASSWLGSGVEITFDRLVWQSEALVTLTVKSISSLSDPNKPIQTTKSLDLSGQMLLSSVDHLHTTLGVIDKKYNPGDSNSLLESYFGSPTLSWSPKSLPLDPPIVVPGRVKFYPTRPAKKFSSKTSKAKSSQA